MRLRFALFSDILVVIPFLWNEAAKIQDFFRYKAKKYYSRDFLWFFF